MELSRWIICLLTIIIAVRTAGYVLTLRKATKEFVGDDDIAEFVARRRLRHITWLLVAEGVGVGWGLNLISVTAPLTWHTVLSAVLTLTMQLTVAYGIQDSARGDREFQHRFADRLLFYCTAIMCPFRQGYSDAAHRK